MSARVRFGAGIRGIGRGKKGVPHRARDEDSLAALVAEHHDFVYRTALGVTGDPHDAEDVAQDAFLAISRGLEGFRGDAALRTWIYRVTVRVALRWLARNRTAGQTSALEPAAPATGLPLELLEAMGRLPMNSRAILLLVAVEGFSHGEAAAALGIPVGTVASRVHTARKQLVRLLDDRGTKAADSCD